MFLFDFMLLESSGRGRLSFQQVSDWLREKTRASLTDAQKRHLWRMLRPHRDEDTSQQHSSEQQQQQAASTADDDTAGNIDWRQFAILCGCLTPGSTDPTPSNGE